MDTLDEYIRGKLASGDFSTKEELLEEALRVYRDLEVSHEQLRAEVAKRLDELNRGEVDELDIESIKAELKAELTSTGTPR